MNETMLMQEKITEFLEIFPTITKEEADYIESVLKWDEETRAAFFFAKRIFEEKEPASKRRDFRKNKRKKE